MTGVKIEYLGVQAGARLALALGREERAVAITVASTIGFRSPH
jgi:hypothetical protein